MAIHAALCWRERTRMARARRFARPLLDGAIVRCSSPRAGIHAPANVANARTLDTCLAFSLTGASFSTRPCQGLGAPDRGLAGSSGDASAPFMITRRATSLTWRPGVRGCAWRARAQASSRLSLQHTRTERCLDALLNSSSSLKGPHQLCKRSCATIAGDTAPAQCLCEMF